MASTTTVVHWKTTQELYGCISELGSLIFIDNGGAWDFTPLGRDICQLVADRRNALEPDPSKHQTWQQVMNDVLETYANYAASGPTMKDPAGGTVVVQYVP